MPGHQFPQSTTTGKRGTVKLLYGILFNEFTTIVDHYSQRYSSNCSTAFFAITSLPAYFMQYCPLHNKLNTQIFFRRSRDIFPAP